MSDRRVSVILPCYNAHRDLGRALDSVRAQTVAADEIIVVDDGSTDPACVAYLDALPGDERVVRQANKGLPGARNAGFREATGDCVVPLDCDDVLDPRFVEKLLAALTASEDAGYAFCHMTLRGEKSGTLCSNFNLFEQLFLDHVPYCILIEKRVWQEIGGYDESMRDGKEDWEFNLSLATHGYYGVLVDEPLFHYNVSGQGMLQSTSNRSHAQLAKYIRTKHAGLFGLNSVLRIWQRWKTQAFTYPKSVSIVLFLMYKILPDWLVNRLFRALLSYSQSNRPRRAPP